MNTMDGGEAAKRLYDCLRERRFAEATFYLNTPLETAPPETLFNIALTNIYLGNAASAIFPLERALFLLKRMPLLSAKPRTEEYRRARKVDIENEIYLMPMSSEYVTVFLDIARENAALAAIYACEQSDNPHKTAAFAAVLNGEEFADFKEKYRV